nr:anaphase-promoting complex subunit 11-like [Lytechinus pictus]
MTDALTRQTLFAIRSIDRKCTGTWDCSRQGVKSVLNVKDKDESQGENWTAVATWRWIANDDNCGICRTAFDGCCPDCKMPGDDCPLVWGQCSHVFHMHCILKWLNSQQVHQLCPMCRQEWKFKE